MSTIAPLSADTLRRLFENSGVGILVANDNGNYVAANQAGCALLGASLEEVVGSSIADFVEDPDSRGLKAQWEKFLRDGQQSGEFELRGMDGITRPVRFCATAHFAPGLHCSFISGVSQRTGERAADRREKTNAKKR